MNLRKSWAGLALACALSAPAASAQEASSRAPTGAASTGDPALAARTLGYEGIGAFQAGDYVLADQKLGQAYRLLPVPSLGLWSARALVKLGFLVEASRRYTEAAGSRLLAGDAQVQRQAQAEAERELAALLPTIPQVAVRLEGAEWRDVALTIDGIEVAAAAKGQPILVNPGQRLIEAQLIDGQLIEGQRLGEKVSTRVTAVASQLVLATLRFAPPAVAPAPAAAALLRPAEPELEVMDAGTSEEAATDPWQTVGWVAVGVGGTALVVSGVAGLAAWQKLDEFDCGGGACVSSDRDAVNGYNSLVTASTVGYLAGGVLAGAGALLLLRHRLWESDVNVGVGPRALTVSGRF